MIGRWIAQVLDEAVPQALGGHDPRGLFLLSGALSFKGCEEKQTVLLDGSADGPAKCIADFVLRNVWQV